MVLCLLQYSIRGFMATKQNKKFITNDIALFLRICANIKKYSGFKPGDCIVDRRNTRYIVSSIDEHGLIWVRQILASGKVSDSEKTFCDWYNPELKIEEGQIDSILLGSEYDPSKDIKEKAKIKNAMTRRNKQKEISMKTWLPTQIESWIASKLTVGKHMWIDYKEFEVVSITPIKVKDNIDSSDFTRWTRSKCGINISILELYLKNKIEYINDVQLKEVKHPTSIRNLHNYCTYYKMYLEQPEVYEDEQNR